MLIRWIVLELCILAIGQYTSWAESLPQTLDPHGYKCTNKTDIDHSCDIGRFGDCGHDKTPCNISVLAQLCDGMHKTKYCWGFNTNGYMKRCLESSCGARTIGSFVSVCIRTDIPTPQPPPPGCPGAPTPSPPTPSPLPPTNCSGVFPPFGPPTHKVNLMDDWHYPPEESDETASLVFPVLIRPFKNTSALLRLPSTNETATVSVGSVMWGWQLNSVQMLVVHDGATVSGAVMEFRFDRWSSMVFLVANQSKPLTMIRKPIGHISALKQPLYYLTNNDVDYECKQDIDPTDWLGNIMANLSNGEPTFVSAISVMAPNPDNGLLGNPEELNKFILSDHGDLETMSWHAGYQEKPLRAVLFSIEDYFPKSCLRKNFPNYKGGFAGRYLRVMNTGMWDPSSECGADILAVSPYTDASNPVSTALLRVVIVNKTDSKIIYLRARADQNTSELIGLDNLGPNGNDFYSALLAQADRWNSWVAGGALPTLPTDDQRYSDTAMALLTGYLNNFRGLTPEYGGGKFWNLYNEYLPLDTLALNVALLEWGQHATSCRYLEHFFHKYMNATTGKIIYGPFGCDSDADYGRLISTFCKAVRYSGNMTWAKNLLPIIENMAGVVLSWRAEAEAKYPPGNPLHGIVPGAPEHDICGGRAHFFSINAWFVRGLQDLHQVLQEYPHLTHNRTLEALLEPTVNKWRSDIQFAANYTAVRRTDGNGLYFLHPCVGSTCSHKEPINIQPGGDEATCLQRGTCFASMTRDRNNQLTNYANFRIFSESLLASVLDPEYERAIMDFRETHRGTLTGMTRFRDVLDDMPILGYGWSALFHDRLSYFHTLLAGHSANYLTRGTFWGTEQRAQVPVVPGQAWRNCCGPGGEHGSLCSVSAIATSMWIRWMLVQDDPDAPFIYLARGAPRRWYQQDEPFGISAAPTRFGLVSYSLKAIPGPQISGSVTLQPNPGTTSKLHFQVAVHVRSPDASLVLKDINVSGATLVALHVANETAVFSSGSSFTFNATFKKKRN